MNNSAVQKEMKRLRSVARDFEYVLMMIDKEVQIHQRAYDQAIDSKTQEEDLKLLKKLNKNVMAVSIHDYDKMGRDETEDQEKFDQRVNFIGAPGMSEDQALPVRANPMGGLGAPEAKPPI